MESRQMGYLLVVGGVIFALFCGFAEQLGIGEGSFGWKQLVGIIVGALIALVGLFMVGRAQSESAGPQEPGTG
jgi:hypothetical protein